jgi:hypothetical protein
MNGSDYDNGDADEQFECKGIYDCVPQKKRINGGMLNGVRKRVKHYGRRRQNAQDSQDKLMRRIAIHFSLL